MVILDELNIAIHHEYLSLDHVLQALARRPPMLHVVITGRGAKPGLIEAADLVSEVQIIKHPFRRLKKESNFNVNMDHILLIMAFCTRMDLAR